MGGWPIEAVFEGDEASVDAMVRFCNEGPRGARRVERVEEHREQPEGLARFEVI